MDNITLKKLASELKYRLVDEKVSENEIIKVLEQAPKLAEVILPATTNLFMEAVSYNKMKVVEKLIALNSDIHLCCRPSAIRGNALNLAKTPEMADYLLNKGIDIIRGLNQQDDFINPALSAIGFNNIDMTFYWLEKESKTLQDDTYIEELKKVSIDYAVTMGQSNMFICIMNNDELYFLLKENIKNTSDPESKKLILNTLSHIKSKELLTKKKELRKILMS